MMVWLRSAATVFVGVLAVLVLSRGTDQILHQLQFYPPWREGMHDPVQNAVALFYRCVYAGVGGYIAAKFAPFRPVAHALTLGGIVCGLLLIGYFATRNLKLVPAWYSLAVVAIAVPSAWAGGVLQQSLLKRH